MAADRSPASGYSPRDLQVHMPKVQTEAVALRWVRCACCAISLGTLAGAALVPSLASSCCRKALLHVDLWVWVATALCTLSYFYCCLASPRNDEESYHPLNDWDEERPVLQHDPDDAGRGLVEDTDCSRHRPEDGGSALDRALAGGQLLTEGNDSDTVAVLPEPVKVMLADAPQPSVILADAEVQTDVPFQAMAKEQVLVPPPDEDTANVKCGCLPAGSSSFSSASRLLPGSSRELWPRSGAQGSQMRWPWARNPLQKCRPEQADQPANERTELSEPVHSLPSDGGQELEVQETPRRRLEPIVEHGAPEPSGLEETPPNPDVEESSPNGDQSSQHDNEEQSAAREAAEASESGKQAEPEASEAGEAGEKGPEDRASSSQAAEPSDSVSAWRASKEDLKGDGPKPEQPQVISLDDSLDPVDLSARGNQTDGNAPVEGERAPETEGAQDDRALPLLEVDSSSRREDERELHRQAAEESAKTEAPRRCCGPCCATCTILGVLLAAGAAAVTRSRPDLVHTLENENVNDLRRQAGSVVEDLRHGAWDLRHGLGKEVERAEDRFGLQAGPTVVLKNMPLHWYIGEWGICSTECGTGRSKRLVFCVNGNTSDCERFGKAPKPDRPCRDVKGCKWHLGSWGKCDAACGAGSKSRNISCATGKDCKDLVERPPEQTSCERSAGCEWDVQPWQACSNSCGHGTARRIVTCKNGPQEYCSKHSAPPPVEKPCHSYDGCKWRPEEWGRCSNSCGSGMQRRSVSCAHGGAAKHCEEEDGRSPRLERACHDVMGCSWTLSKWSDCSSSCGVGMQSRNVSCSTGSTVDCLAHAPMPPREQSCAAYHGCTWVTGEWGICIAECGNGLRRRSVTCANGSAADCHLGPDVMPDRTKPCYNVTDCSWATGPWTPCSNICGEGRRYRMVTCGNGWEKDCRAKEAPPFHQQHCTETSGCLGLQGRDGCECFASDPVMLLAGALDAVSGWSVSFAVMHKLVSLAPEGEASPLGAVALLSAPSALIASLGALAAATVLQSAALLPNVIQYHEVPLGRKLVLPPGLLGFGFWLLALCSLCLLGREVQRRPSCAVFMLALSFCGMVLFMVPLGEGAYVPMERATRRLADDVQFV